MRLLGRRLNRFLDQKGLSPASCRDACRRGVVKRNCANAAAGSSTSGSQRKSAGQLKEKKGGGEGGGEGGGKQRKKSKQQLIDLQPPRGTRDFLPPEMRLRTWLFDKFRQISTCYGFEEVCVVFLRFSFEEKKRKKTKQKLPFVLTLNIFLFSFNLSETFFFFF